MNFGQIRVLYAVFRHRIWIFRPSFSGMEVWRWFALDVKSVRGNRSVCVCLKVGRSKSHSPSKILCVRTFTLNLVIFMPMTLTLTVTLSYLAKLNVRYFFVSRDFRFFIDIKCQFDPWTLRAHVGFTKTQSVVWIIKYLFLSEGLLCFCFWTQV